MITVLLADDHALMRSGLKHILEEEGDISVIAEAADGIEAAELYMNTRPDVVILDVSMPEMDGLEALKCIMDFDRHARVLILTIYPEKFYAIRLLKAGALGYITKGISTKELPTAVRIVAQGKSYISDTVKDVVTMQIIASKSRLSPVEILSNRELQVLGLIANGYKVRKIAEHLGVSIKTVQTYRARILEKLCLESDADICRFAFDNKLIQGMEPPAE